MCPPPHPPPSTRLTAVQRGDSDVPPTTPTTPASPPFSEEMRMFCSAEASTLLATTLRQEGGGGMPVGAMGGTRVAATCLRRASQTRQRASRGITATRHMALWRAAQRLRGAGATQAPSSANARGDGHPLPAHPQLTS
jgi:hypothetical protein